MPKKEKTIGVNFFANTRLKEKTSFWNGKKVSAYPLYARVTYDGENAQFKVELGDSSPILVTEDLPQIQQGSLRRQLEQFEDKVRDLVKKELALYGEDFSFIGFGKRFYSYDLSLLDCLFDIKLKEYYRLHNGEFHIWSGHFLSVIAPLYLLALEKTKITIYDWVFDDGKKRLEQIIDNNNAAERPIIPIHEDSIEVVIALYDRIIEKHYLR